MTCRSVTLTIFWGLVLAATVFFVASQLRHSAAKPMWLDEVYSLHYSTRGPEFASLLVRGAPGQASPAPLDYLLLKALDALRLRVQLLGLHPHAYYRLPSLLACVLAGLVMVAAARKHFSDNPQELILQSVFILMALLLFWFGPWTHRYAAEMRPYALWNSLWLVSLAFFFLTPVPVKLVSFVLLLLGMTAVAGCYQLAALGGGYGVVQLWSGRSWQQTAKDMLVIFAIPSGVCLYYIAKVNSWNYIEPQWGTWDLFWGFYAGQLQVLLYCLAGVLLCAFHRQTRSYSVPAFAMCLLFMMGPLIYWLTRSRGFFFSERQFIYYSTAAPIFFLSLSACLPVWRKKIAGKRNLLVWFISLVLVGGIYLEQLHENFENVTYQLSSDIPWNVPADPKRALENLLRQELPAGFCVEGEATSASRGNLDLIAEWLPVYFSDLPEGDKVVHVRSIRDENMEVLSISTQPCESGDFVRRGLKLGSRYGL